MVISVYFIKVIIYQIYTILSLDKKMSQYLGKCCKGFSVQPFEFRSFCLLSFCFELCFNAYFLGDRKVFYLLIPKAKPETTPPNVVFLGDG